MIREAKEEVGIELTHENLEVVHVMHRDSQADESNERIDIFFTASGWKGEIKNMEPNKCDDLSWFDLKDLQENTIDYVKNVLEGLGGGIQYSEHGWGEK